MNGQRLAVLKDIAARIAKVRLKHPLRIAIDGRTAAGKTTISDTLADLLRQQGRPVIRASIDGFHRPKAARYARGRYSPEGYYYDARDLVAIVNLLLLPLGPGGNRLYRTISFDLERDEPLEQQPLRAPDTAILIVDGTFLQRPELRENWDLTVFIKTSAKIAEQRAVGRDAAALGGTEVAQKIYIERYRAAFDLYEKLCAPEEIADAVLNNEDFAEPTLQLRDGCLLAEQAPVRGE